MIRIGECDVDLKGLIIYGPVGAVTMEAKVMKLLSVLASRQGEVMTRDELIASVWGVEHGGDESLSRGISLIRKALGDKRGQHKYILTVPKVGYRLIAEVVSTEDYFLPPETTAQENDTKPSEALSIGGLVGKPVLGLASSKTTNLHNQSNASILSTDRKGFWVGGSVLASLFIVAILASSLAPLGGWQNASEFSTQAQIQRGFSHIGHFTPKGAVEDAQSLFEDVLQQDPENATARAGLAFAVFREYTHLERDPSTLRRATAHASAALRKNEHLALANIAAAWSAEFEGDLERSHQLLDRADVLETDNRLALEGRYRTYLKQDALDKASDVINHAIDVHPDHALFYTYRAALAARNDDLDSAEQDFRRSIDITPDNARSYAELAHILHLRGDTQGAVDTLQKGLEVNETALLYNNLGTYLFFQGQYELAASAFEKTLSVVGDTHDYLYWANLGDAYRWSAGKQSEASENYKRAIQLLEAEMERLPDNQNLKSRAALFNAKLGNLDQAMGYMDQLTLTPQSPPIQLYRAVVTYEIMSDREAALEYLEAAIRADYPMIEISNDPELAQLRQDRAYHRLLAKTLN